MYKSCLSRTKRPQSIITLQCCWNIGKTVVSFTTTSACFLVRTTHCKKKRQNTGIGESTACLMDDVKQLIFFCIYVYVNLKKQSCLENDPLPEILSSSYKQEQVEPFSDCSDLLLYQQSCIQHSNCSLKLSNS